jgi:protein-tyrosine phosphatase
MRPGVERVRRLARSMSDLLAIDLHAHVLPGLDDGPPDLESAVALCAALHDAGVRTVVATPHVKPTWPTTPQRRDHALARLREQLEAGDIEIDVLPAGELDIAYAASMDDDQLAGFAIRDNLLVVETPFGRWQDAVTETCLDLVDRGWRVTLAHPERNIGVQLDPTVLDDVRRVGVTAHATTEGFAGTIGSRVQACAFALIETGRIDAIATDAHDVTGRPPSIAAAHAACVAHELDPRLIHQLFVVGPANILGD